MAKGWSKSRGEFSDFELVKVKGLVAVVEFLSGAVARDSFTLRWDLSVLKPF